VEQLSLVVTKPETHLTRSRNGLMGNAQRDFGAAFFVHILHWDRSQTD
jgi:hypothetical protein